MISGSMDNYKEQIFDHAIDQTRPNSRFDQPQKSTGQVRGVNKLVFKYSLGIYIITTKIQKI